MKRLLGVAIVGGTMTVHAGLAAGGAEIVRTVYFAAVDGKGAPITDLAASDLAIKEGGKDRAVRSVEAAKSTVQVSLLVDDGGTGAFQAAVAQFLETMLGHAQFTIRAFNPQPSKVADFTEDIATLKAALNGIGPRGNVASTGEQMVDAVAEAAQELQRHKAARPAIVVLTVGGEPAQSIQAEPALNALRNSGASLSVIYRSGLELGQVLGDGPKRSGGLIQQIGGGVVLGPVLAKVADTLLHQYALTYTLPDGVKPNEKFALATTRKGVTLLAPTRIADK
jgi:VWA domain-containing protein